MPDITHFNGGTIVTGKGIGYYQMLARRGALALEIKGLRRSGGRTAYSICKSEYNLRGNRESVLKQMDALIVETCKSLDIGTEP